MKVESYYEFSGSNSSEVTCLCQCIKQESIIPVLLSVSFRQSGISITVNLSSTEDRSFRED